VTVRRSEWEIDDLADVQWREDWCTWLERYGIAPSSVCVPGWLEADDDARQIRYLAYVHDEHGRPVLRPHKLGVERTVRVLQLEARALPFPEASG
jgi:hypothetical protein